MSLDVYLTRVQETQVFSANITHNLGKMADAADIYKALWRPEELFEEPKASDLIPLLKEGLFKLKANPAHYKQYNASNGWGIYEHFVLFVEEYLEACKEYPDAKVTAYR